MNRLKAWIEKLLYKYGKCKHKALSRVFTDSVSKKQYQVCVDCGRRFDPSIKF